MPYGDILARVGVLPGSGKPGYVPGFDVTGTVEQLGASVAGLEVGEPVTALLPHGGSAEAVWVPADLQLPLPQGVSPVAAAALRSFVAVVRGAGGADAAFDAIGGVHFWAPTGRCAAAARWWIRREQRLERRQGQRAPRRASGKVVLTPTRRTSGEGTNGPAEPGG